MVSHRLTICHVKMKDFILYNDELKNLSRTLKKLRVNNFYICQ